MTGRFYPANAETGRKILPTSDYDTALASAVSWAYTAGYDVSVISLLNNLPVTVVSPNGDIRQA